MMGQDIHIACQCGAFHAVIHDNDTHPGNHAVCYCVDCRAFARHLGQMEHALDASGGTALYQVQPFQVEITQGIDKIVPLKLSPSGIYRWHTSCCGTPMCNMPGKPQMSFVGFLAANVTSGKEALGAVALRYKTEQATGPVPVPHGSMVKFILRVLRNMLSSRLNGKWKQNPFFGADARALVKPHLLSDAERKAAYAR